MTTLSTAALVSHDLALAAGFGGALFGTAALDPAVKTTIDDKSERGQVVNRAWMTFGMIDALSLGVVATTWLTGRSAMNGRFVGRDVRNLVMVKDVLIGSAIVMCGAKFLLGSRIRAAAPGGAIPLESGNVPAAGVEPRIAGMMTAVKIMNYAGIGVVAGLIAVTDILTMKASKSSKWNVVARLFLP
jgi:hypothetical protein